MRARPAVQRYAGLAAIAAIVAVMPLILPNRYFFDVAILVGLNAIVCIGLNLLIGYAGQISLGHAGFFGLGAYGSALLTQQGSPPTLALIAAAALVALIAFLLGRPILRLRGHYLAMATLGLGIIIAIVITTEERLTGGPDGMNVAPFSLFGWSLAGERAWFWCVGALLLLCIWLSLNLVDSPIGRALRAIHGSETAAQAMGVDVARAKLKVFVVSAVFAAVAGSLTAHYSGFITPAKVGFLHSIELVTMVVLGGMASTYGAVFGAAILTALPQFLTVFREYEALVLGLTLMATMIFLPRGLVPSLAALVRARA
jgi:branched-chain amino acid transport system permease protein